MGVKISVDKYVSELDDLIDLSPHYLSRVPFESRISPDIMQHLKIWRFYESKKNHDRVKSAPLPLFQLNENAFAFSQEESYLVLLIYKSGAETSNDLSNFPQALWNVVQSSTENLTPRGLSNTFASNIDDLDKSSADNFIQTTRRRKDGDDSARNGDQNSIGKDGKPVKDPKNKKRGSQKSSQSAQQSKSGDSGQSGDVSYKYMIYVWSGKQASQNIRAQVLTKGYALNNYLQQAQDSGLNVLFSGGVIKNKKLQRGSIFMFEDVIEPGQMPNQAPQKRGYNKIGNDPTVIPNCSHESILKAHESIFLLKWLYPEIQGKVYREKMGSVKHGKFPKFHEQFISDSMSSTTTGSTTMRSVEIPVPAGTTTATRTAQPAQSSSGRGIQQKQGSGRQQPGNQVKTQPVTQSQAYWERFECIDEIDEIELDEMIMSMQAGANKDMDESDDDNVPLLNDSAPGDVDMINEENKDLFSDPEPAQQYGEFNQDMLNEEIEDIDSDDEQLALAQYYQQQKEHQRIQSKKVPGLSLGGLGGGAPTMGQSLALNINQPPVPGLSLAGDAATKIPALGGFSNLGGFDTSDQNTSGRMSSKRDGIGRLNLNKALDIQRELLDKADEMQRIKQGAPGGLAPIKDVDEAQYGSNQPGGLNLGGIGAPSGGLSLPLAGSMSNVDAPPALRRGGDLESHQNIVKMGRGQNEGDANQIQEKLDEQFDWKGTSRKQYENVMFNNVCSQIIDGFIFLGSDNVAKDYEKLKENGITHVINCARDFSADYHVAKGIKYLSFHLKDHVQENIESVFYEVIDFFESAKAAGGRVFVHCVQGISRSSTMIIAYLIFSQRMSQEEALALVRARRQIANPNMAFLTQLIQFHKRLYDKNYNSIKVMPRVFLVSSHQPEDPYKISCQLLLKNLFDGMMPQLKLDPRAMLIVQGPPSSPIYIWQGAQLPSGNFDPYLSQARKHISLLQQHEGANKSQPIIVKQGQEPADFWKVLMNGRPQESEPYSQTKEWTRLLINLETINYEKQAPMVEKMEQYIETVEEERKFKAKLYTYPNWQESCTVFDDEDLLNDALLVLCVKAQFGPGLPEGSDRHKVYIWRGADFEEDEEDGIDETGAKVSSSSKEFVSRAMEQYWGCRRPEDQYNIEIHEEFQGRESEEFLDQF